MSKRCDLGFIGLGVMGKSLTLNLADNGYHIACFDLDREKLHEVARQDKLESGNQASRVHIYDSLNEIMETIQTPRIIILSVPAGAPVDSICQQLIELDIQADDIVVDTGNSLWTNSVEREAKYQGKFKFFSVAVSGGEVGARFGPSLMPSGDKNAWQRLAPMMRAIAAKVDSESGRPIESYAPGKPITQGEPCVTYIGEMGAGHYVKMVHNGIEYADMQLICEAYQIMREHLDMPAAEIAKVFAKWDQGRLNSYLMQISAEILAHQDAESGLPLVNVILDKAGQKGTGLWTAVSALQVGSPAQTIAQAVFARTLSSLKQQRVKASEYFSSPESTPLSDQEKTQFIQALHDAIYCAKVCVYAQGFQLMDIAAKEHGWQLNFAEIAKIWRAGCIIRAAFLHSITEAYQKQDDLQNLLFAPFFAQQITHLQSNWRKTVAQATLAGIPCGALSSALNYFDSFRCAVLPANLLQAQRDFFGAHSYQRVDKPEQEYFHTLWSDPQRPEQQVK